MITEIPKFIKSQYGDMLIVEHHPEVSPPKYWVIAFNSGLQCRSGPRRLYVYLANALTQLGLGVIRVDLPGVGDSDGPIPATHFDMHNPVDAQCVIDYMENTYHPEGIIVQGLCAGSRVAIKVAAANPSVKAVLAWSTTIFSTTPGATKAPEESKHGVSKSVAEYNLKRVTSVFKTAKFLKLSFWKNHLTSGTLTADLKNLFWATLQKFTGIDPPPSKSAFIGALESYTKSKRPIHVVYGERDQYCHMEFKELGLGIPESDIVIIPNGTHTFSTIAQREEVLEKTKEWIKKYFLL